MFLFSGVNLQNCGGAFSGSNNAAGGGANSGGGGGNGGASRQRLLELSHGLGALRHYNDLANHVLSLNQQGAVVTKLLGEFIILIFISIYQFTKPNCQIINSFFYFFFFLTYHYNYYFIQRSLSQTTNIQKYVNIYLIYTW